MNLRNVKVLTDENISPKVVRFLRDIGLDVLDVKEQHWYGREDEAILDIAFREQRFIYTHDSDFGTLAVNMGRPYYGIVYLKLKNLKPENVARICNQVIQKDLDISPGTILVIEETRIRVRHPSYEE